MTNFGDECDVYEKSIKDCCKPGNEEFLTYLYKLSQTNVNNKGQDGGGLKAVNNWVKDVICTSCKYSDYQRFKMFVDLMRNDTTFDINQIYIHAKLVSMDVVSQVDNFNIFKVFLEHKDINIDGADLLIQCVAMMKIDMVKYLIKNNGTYKGWKCDLRKKCDLNQLLTSISWWHRENLYGNFGNDFYIKHFIEERKSIKNSMCDCITVAIISTLCQLCDDYFNHRYHDDKEPKFDSSMLNVLFSSGILSKKEITDMGESWLEVIILMGGKDMMCQSNRHEAVYLCFTYLVGGADGNAVDDQTGESLIKATNLILHLLHEYKHVGPDSCLQLLLDARVP